MPGSVAFVVSLVGREGVEFSTWASYAITGAMQAALLVSTHDSFFPAVAVPEADMLGQAMCLAWKRRQARLGVDDFGQPLSGVDTAEERD